VVQFKYIFLYFTDFLFFLYLFTDFSYFLDFLIVFYLFLGYFIDLIFLLYLKNKNILKQFFTDMSFKICFYYKIKAKIILCFMKMIYHVSKL
jgi:hypothetical protein